MVTHNHCVGSLLIREKILPLALACWSIGSPQIRNRGTVAGNLITASPANDTIPALIALGASVTLKSKHESRIVPLLDFYQGVRKTCMNSDEMLVEIVVPAMRKGQQGIFVKQALRRAQAISVTNAAIVIDRLNGPISRCNICLGSVAPTIIHATKAESFLIGKELSKENIQKAGELAAEDALPIDDLRGSKQYRKEMVKNNIIQGLQCLSENKEKEQMPAQPVLLRGIEPYNHLYLKAKREFKDSAIINTTINGKRLSFNTVPQKTLLRFIREDAKLTGTKEGCAEGECGACTVFLDGISVMSCLVPAARADQAEIVTIENFGGDGHLHPVQKAFIDEGAVQCGYCTPGFIMSAIKLYEERDVPENNEIKTAISGNLCRCTGYYSIVRAIENSQFRK
jgi:carbon-monoxide dehydrogenase medium subunit